MTAPENALQVAVSGNNVWKTTPPDQPGTTVYATVRSHGSGPAPHHRAMPGRAARRPGRVGVMGVPVVLGKFWSDIPDLR